MRIKIFILFIFILAVPAAGKAQQDKKTDSLLNALKNQKEDTAKVNTLNALSRRLTQLDDYAAAIKYAEEAVSLAKTTRLPDGSYGFKKGIGNAYNNLGNIYFYQGNYSEELKNHLASLKPRDEAGDKKAVIITYNNIGLVNWNAGNYPEAYKNYFTALKIREEIGDQLGLAHSYNVLGVINDDEGNYPGALKNYLISLKIYEKLKADFGIAACNNNIGELYRKQDNFDKALKSFGRSLEIYKKTDDAGGIAMAYNNMGVVYRAQGNYTEALRNFLGAGKLYEEAGDKEGIASVFGNVGTVYYDQGRSNPSLSEKGTAFKEALKNLFNGLKIFEETNARDGMAESYTTIGKLYTELKQFSEARKFLNDGLILSKERGVKELIKDSYQAMAKLDSATGNWEGAFINQNLYIYFRYSLLNKENSVKLQHLQIQYEFDKKEDSLNYLQALTKEKLKRQTLLTKQQQQTLLLKEKEFTLISNERKFQQLQIEKNQVAFAVQKVIQKAEADKRQAELMALNKEKAIQTLELNKQKTVKNYLLGGLVLFSVLSFFIYNNYRTRQKLKLQTLRNKIASDLHDDVGSTLSSISIFSQMAQQQSKEVNPLLETIGESSRKMLDAMADIVWTVNPENDQFEKIILRMRSFAYELLGAKGIDFEFIADEDTAKLNLSMDVRKNLYLIFKEATNNMVKYSGADKAFFSIKKEKDNLTMLIQDNGKGFDAGQSGQGNGLINMRKRADEIKAQLMIKSFPGKGTTIQISVAA
jgi:two-component system sensor histidine kinase UhpB